MKVKQYLEQVAYIGKSDITDDEGKIYLSKFDDSYITRVGMEDNVKYLAEREITDELTHGVGFSPKDNKWYGWSHRAIFGFEIGSICEKGHCHYVPSTPEALIDDHADFFLDISQESADSHRRQCQILDDRSGIRILNEPIALPVIHGIENVADALEDVGSLPEEQIFKDDFYEIKCGRGEWTAKTMEDAKQMAKDFNEGVS